MHIQDERSLGDLFAELSSESSRLIRQEVNLATKELGQKVSHAGKDIILVAVGVGVAYAGFLALVGTAVIALFILTHHWWLSGLIVGLVVLGAGYLLIQNGLNNLRQEDMKPHRTIESLRQSGEWVKQEAK